MKWILIGALAAACATAQTKKGSAPAGDSVQGKTEYQRCAFCHDGGANGPDLKGLFKRKQLSDNKTPLNDQTVRAKIAEGGNGMPPGSNLKPKQLDDLIAYLKTL